MAASAPAVPAGARTPTPRGSPAATAAPASAADVQSPGDGASGAGLGGAVFNLLGSLTITNSTLAINAALGGAGNASGQGGSGFGGAIFNLDGTAILVNDTFAGNHVVAGDGNNADADDVYNLALNVGFGTSTTATVSLTNDDPGRHAVAINDVVNNTEAAPMPRPTSRPSG